VLGRAHELTLQPTFCMQGECATANGCNLTSYEGEGANGVAHRMLAGRSGTRKADCMQGTCATTHRCNKTGTDGPANAPEGAPHWQLSRRQKVHKSSCMEGSCGAKRACNKTENAEGGHGQAHRLRRPDCRTTARRFCMEGEGHSGCTHYSTLAPAPRPR
jgi:hypothetical protein